MNNSITTWAPGRYAPETPPRNLSPEAVAQRHAWQSTIVYATPDGEAICRANTPESAQWIADRLNAAARAETPPAAPDADLIVGRRYWHRGDFKAFVTVKPQWMILVDSQPPKLIGRFWAGRNPQSLHTFYLEDFDLARDWWAECAVGKWWINKHGIPMQIPKFPNDKDSETGRNIESGAIKIYPTREAAEEAGRC